jgi:hypothetical protein
VSRRVAAALAHLASFLAIDHAISTADPVPAPRVELAQCTALDRAALRRAIDAELAGLAADKRAAVGDRVVVVACPDAVTAHLSLEPTPATGPVARSLDLGEVPGPLRARLVALAVVEVVDVAAMVGAAAAPPAPAPEPAPTPAPPAPDDRPSGIDPTPLGPGTQPPATVAAIAPPADAATEARVDRGVTAPGPARAMRRSLADGGARLRGRTIAPRVGVRLYPTGPASAVPMLAVSVDLVQGAVVVGITAAAGQVDDPLGTVRPLLAAGSAGLTLACARAGALEACATGRVTAGLAAATASPASAMTPASTATAPYLELGGQLELAWRGRHRALVVALDAGWAEGLIATAGPREVARLDGAALAATIGARW